MVAVSVRAADGQIAATEKERDLIEILASDAPKAEKAIACKHLAVYGSSAAAPELAKLLGDEQLASWARIALEAIPGPAADEALRKSLDSVKGELLIGAINSIGVRRDAGAVENLVDTLSGGRKARFKGPEDRFNRDSGVASAAAVALGHIGGDAAANALRKALAYYPPKGDTDADVRDGFKKWVRPLRSAVAEGLVLCAERFLSEGRDKEAIEIYDEVRKAEVPKPRVIEATRGAILARKQDGLALLLEQLRSPDKEMFQIALGTVREFPGRQVDESLAGELASATPQRAALVIHAMADRTETVVVSAVLKAAGSGPKEVRIAAIGALGRVGNTSCVSPLLEIALEADAELAQATKAALAELPGDDVDQDVVARLSQAQGKMYPLLIELVGQRRSVSGGGLRGEAVAVLVKALDHSDAAVRGAALTSLGETVSAKDLSVLISQVIAPKHADDSPAAQQALKAASVRMPDREACAAELAKAVETSPAPTKSVLLEILGAVGGTKALAALGAAAKSADPQLQDVSSRLLGEWMTIDAAPVLLDLAKSGPADKYQVRALRGYIRIARQFIMSDQQRVEMCQNAFEASRQPAEQKLVLELLNRHPNPETLKLAVKIMQVPQLKDEAAQVALAIAQKLGGKADEVQSILSKAGLEKVKLEIVKAEYGAAAAWKDVTEILRKQLADVQLIALPSSTYNEAFGGDPAPGTPKQLKIQYRINGKAGDASFAENALIVLPMPK